MASDRSAPQNHLTPQSIPLQDLTRSPNPAQADSDEGSNRRGFSERTRAFVGNRQSFSGRVNTTGRYQRVAEESPPRSNRNGLTLPHVTTPRNAHQPYSYDDGELSPVNAGDFQAAMGSVGLSFEPAGPSQMSIPVTPSAGGRGRSMDRAGETGGVSPLTKPTMRFTSDDDESYFSPTGNDRTPLTDQRYLQPISGSQLPAPSGQRHERQGSMLGDDLPSVEAGLRRPLSTHSARSLSRSLSVSAAGSPLSRAGSMVRKMSQRVVNLSNEPELVEQTVRRQPSATPSVREARLEEPPSFPALDEYMHDDSQSTSPPFEKIPPSVRVDQVRGPRKSRINPLKGRSLGVFEPDNWLRLRLCDLLVHPFTEPVILVLILFQTVLLAVQTFPKLPYGGRPKTWYSSWIDPALLVLFVIYTLEIGARMIVSGFIKNAKEYATVDWDLGFKRVLIMRINNVLTPDKHQLTTQVANRTDLQPSIVRSFTSIQSQADQPSHGLQQQRDRLARRAFLRHSFNRLDFLAVISYWIAFILSTTGIASQSHIYVFQMLSCLRILRLLGLTSGTSVILRSLKRAAPLLANVAFLIGFFWLLFAIVGVQMFKSSFRRTCVWYEKIDTVRSNQFDGHNYTWNVAPENIQLCGGYINATTKEPWPWLKADLENGTRYAKGYLCPMNSICLEGSNPYNGTVSFDNVFQSLQLVFVIMSNNTFSDLLYMMTSSDYLAAALFFAVGIVILSLWLTNLLIAVITSSFQVIREESRASAFTTGEQVPIDDEEEEEIMPEKTGTLKRAFDKTYWAWITIIVFGLVVQCLRSATMSEKRQLFIDGTETVVTLLLVVEIILRFLTDWRNFHKSRRNWVDLGIAIITAVMQLPTIRHTRRPYVWMTFFQIIRVYRVVLAVPLTRDLIMIVLGNVTGLLNLILFVGLITLLVAIFAVQIFRGQFPFADEGQTVTHIPFTDLYNSFLGMYQVLSSENWTILMYNATQFTTNVNTAWVGAAFFILWFILANFIVLNMFIAVIQENFDITEDEKRLQQVRAFLQQKELSGSSHSNLSLSAIFRLGRDSRRHKDPFDYGPASLEMLLKDAVVRDFLDEQPDPTEDQPADDPIINGAKLRQVRPGLLSPIWGKVIDFVQNREPNPFYSRLQFSRAQEELDPRTLAKEVVSATEQRKRAQRQYLQKHPTYNVSLFLFKPENPIRRACQHVVGPGRGSQRIQGVDPIRPLWYSFSFFIYASIVTMVVLACLATPLYQREYFHEHGFSVRNWFVWTDMAFAAIFTIEAIIKVIADGFFWTPNAYFRGSWGFIDGLVLITLWINVVTSLYNDGAVSRAVGAFKALRALRLLNVSDSARDTFHTVIVIGGWKILSAAFVSLSLLVPFAIYGVNLFNGQMFICNDLFSNITNLDDCVGEWNSTPSGWPVLAPRQVANPYYKFDDFASSLFILFQIVSQEGWIDVMWSAMGISGVGKQFQPFVSQGNAIFFIIFNLLASVFVVTLFISVFMRNYTEQTGVAFLTADQRSWLELRKLLRQISPSKRPSNQSETRWRAWCYKIAIKKHGKWQKFLTAILFLHLIILCLETYPESETWNRIRDYLFLAFTVFYICNIVIRIVGLSWQRFSKSSWDVYSVVSVAGTVITTFLALSDNRNELYGQLHKFFLASIALLLIPRNNQLDQLFKTAAASLSSIGNVMATWFVLFLVYAIALTQTFSLTKFGSLENGNLNFRNVPKALILLFRMSCGESWNQIMEDFAGAIYPKCVESNKFSDSDCGSPNWARALFISWNIISMYIFVSLFVSLIYESFSYVYQRSSGLSVVTREEIRRFKQAWATYDPEGTGYISKEAFPRLLGELSGVFEMHIYDGEHSVNRILEDCRDHSRGTDSPAGVVHGVDLAKLNARIRTINVPEIRQRRKRLETFCTEIFISADIDRGINFTSCLMILAHYSVISDNKSLRLEEFLRRRARLQLVEEETRRRVVRGFFDTMYWSREFRSRLDFRHSARMMTIPQFAVPEIFIDDQDAVSPHDEDPYPGPSQNVSPRGSPRSRPQIDTGGLRRRTDSRGGSPSRSDTSIQASPQMSPRIGTSPQLSPHRHRPSPSVASAASGGFSWSYDGTTTPEERLEGGRSRAGSSVDRQNVLEVFDNSAWGESIRRSFTLRRNGTRRRGSRS